MTGKENVTSASKQRSRAVVGFTICVGLLMYGMFSCSQISLKPYVDTCTQIHAQTTSTTPLSLPPGTKSIIINVGGNVSPILPKPSAGACARTIAFEPMVYDQVRSHPQLIVVPAAVSEAEALASMHFYNRLGLSSSFATAARWGINKTNVKVVPVVSMSEVLRSIPSHVNIDFIMTDVQGFDFMIVKSCLNLLRQRQVKLIRTEVYLMDKVDYDGVQNDLCADWIPLMESNGYELILVDLDPGTVIEGYGSMEEARATCKKPRSKRIVEVNALWYLTAAREREGLVDWREYQLPTFTTADKYRQLPFTAEEYNSCY